MLDASAVVRALGRESSEAVAVVEGILSQDVRAHVPDLVTAETANALTRLVRAGRLPPVAARTFLAALAEWPLVRHSSGILAEAALAWALASRLSAYDAFYAVLADALEAPLVTADRRMAAAVPNAMLVA